MNIINNLSSSHYQVLQEIVQNADTLCIVSPFLMESFDPLLFEIRQAGVKTVQLITTLKSRDRDLIKKASSLHSFCTLCKQLGIEYQVYIDNKLHGKIFIASKNGDYIAGILTSANLTNKGMSNNHEWGILIYDARTLAKLKDEVLSVCDPALSDQQITSIIEKIDAYDRSEQEPPMPPIDLSVEEFLNSTFIQNGVEKKYFLKPVGWSGSYYPVTSTLDSDMEMLRFARTPLAVNKGDIIICYAVGTTKLLGYFEVVSMPIYSDQEFERWPYCINGKNLCPKYSQNWTMFENTLSRVRSSYGSDKTVTHVGGKTLGALNFGSDKIRLSDDFALYIIDLMNRNISSASLVTQ